MVNRLRLNEKTLRDAEPKPCVSYQIFDTDVRGFAVCIYPSGSRAFTIDYRHADRQRRMTIGRWPEWSTTAARKRATELRREIDAGGDPLSLLSAPGLHKDRRSTCSPTNLQQRSTSDRQSVTMVRPQSLDLLTGPRSNPKLRSQKPLPWQCLTGC